MGLGVVVAAVGWSGGWWCVRCGAGCAPACLLASSAGGSPAASHLRLHLQAEEEARISDTLLNSMVPPRIALRLKVRGQQCMRRTE